MIFRLEVLLGRLGSGFSLSAIGPHSSNEEAVKVTKHMLCTLYTNVALRDSFFELQSIRIGCQILCLFPDLSQHISCLLGL